MSVNLYKNGNLIPIAGNGGGVEVDAELSAESENPVQNKAIDAKIKELESAIAQATAALNNLKQVAKTGSYNDLTDKPTIPTSLKNPQPLVFSGGSSVSYDGSEKQTVNIPTVPQSLKNPQPLKFTGSSSVSYDGSSQQTVNIPAAVRVKGEAETNYHTGDVNLTAGEVGALPVRTWTQLGVTQETTLDELYEKVIKPATLSGHSRFIIFEWINNNWEIRNEIMRSVHPEKYNDGSHAYGQHGLFTCLKDANTGYFKFLSFNGNNEWTGNKGYDNTGDIQFTVSYINSQDGKPRYKSVFSFTGGRSFKYLNVAAEAALWVSDSSQTGYSYKADIPFNGVTSFFSPVVVFSAKDADSGNFAPVANSGNGIVSIYAKTKPTAAMEIPLIYCII